MAPKATPVGTSVNPIAPGTRRHGIEPSGPRGDNPATAGSGPTSVRSNTPENAEGEINPSPENSNTTSGTLP